jgi:hypothetical protein
VEAHTPPGVRFSNVPFVRASSIRMTSSCVIGSKPSGRGLGVGAVETRAARDANAAAMVMTFFMLEVGQLLMGLDSLGSQGSLFCMSNREVGPHLLYMQKSHYC